MSYGEPTSYLQAATGIDVISSDGDRVGRLAHILADEQSSIFDGIVIDIHGGHRFVDAPEVTEFYEQAVIIDIPAADVPNLPEPTANPGTITSHGDDSDSPLTVKLRRAWDYISGNY